jgi:rare lipoprotein A
VQVGAFAVPANAERLAGRLATLGPVDVAPITSGGRTLQRVRLGPFTSRQAANQALAQVHAAGYPDAVVMR